LELAFLVVDVFQIKLLKRHIGKIDRSFCVEVKFLDNDPEQRVHEISVGKLLKVLGPDFERLQVSQTSTGRYAINKMMKNQAPGHQVPFHEFLSFSQAPRIRLREAENTVLHNN
jgi:hypothetical protein